MNKGSMLILALITVLILSFMVAAGIRTATTELFTTQNVFLKSSSFYYAVEGTEEIAKQIDNVSNPASISNDKTIQEGGLTKRYFTGDMIDDNSDGIVEVENVKFFQGFPAPPPMGMSLGANSGVTPSIWYFEITSEVSTGSRKSFTEVEAGVYKLLPGY